MYNDLFNIDLGPPDNDENNENEDKQEDYLSAPNLPSPGIPYKEGTPSNDIYIPADMPKKPDLEVTLSYLRTLEMFGSLEWFDNGRGIKLGSRGLFVIGDALSKRDVINIAIAERTTLIVELVAMEREPTERMVFQVRPAYVIIDEDIDKIEEAKTNILNEPMISTNVYYVCGCGRNNVKVNNARHLEALMSVGKIYCPKCGIMCNLEIDGFEEY